MLAMQRWAAALSLTFLGTSFAVGETVQVRRLTTLVGAPVLVGTDSFGTIEEIILNENGCLDYLVVSHENKHLVLPWGIAQVNFDRRSVVLNVERQRLIQAPSFSGSDWTQITRPEFSQQVHRFYNVQGRSAGYVDPNLGRNAAGATSSPNR